MTGQAIGEVLALGVGVALSPLAVVALVILLVRTDGAGPGWAFGAAWLVVLAAGSAVVVVLADDVDATGDTGPATWVSVVKVLVAVLLVGFAVRQWRGRDDAADGGGTPGWMRRLEGIGAPGAAGVGALFAAKPKNLLLTIAAGVVVAQVGASRPQEAIALAIFVLLASAGLAVPVAIRVGLRARGTAVLAALRDWMVEANTTIIAVVSLVIAAKLLGDALVALAG